MRIVTHPTEVFNNNPNLTEYHIETHSPEWYQFRSTGVPGVYDGGFGASEIGTILGLSDYRPVLPELLQQKDGGVQPRNRVTEASLSGILAEQSILERWQYWDGTELGYLTHWQNRAIQRKYKTLDCYIVNEKFPWLFASLDASVLKGEMSMGGVKLTQDSPIECKKISYFVTKKWENKIPPSHVAQVQQQMLVTDTEWAELAVLMEGPSGPVFSVYPVERNEGFCNVILKRTEELYHLVLEMRSKRAEIEKSKVSNPSRVDNLLVEYESMLPLPDENEAYKDYYAERYLKESEKIEGSMQDFKHAKERVRMAEAIKVLSKKQQYHENFILEKFVRSGAEYIEFEGNGRIRYYTQKGKNKPQLDFRSLNIPVNMEVKI